MATESPLFQSSMELLAHSISHFNAGAELDRKLLILHLANSVELLLKDLVLDTGASIYKNSKETLTIHGCLQALQTKKVELPYLNKIELLIDERNALQHRFGSPNELTSIFYMDIVMAFMKDVLSDHYHLELDETLDQFAVATELHAFRMRQPSNESELEGLKKLGRVHPLGALLAAMAYLERVTIRFAEDVGIERRVYFRPVGMMSPRTLGRYGITFPPALEERLNDVRRLRNLAAHGRKDPTAGEVASCIETIEEYDRFLSEVDREAARATVAATSIELQRERSMRDEASAETAIGVEIRSSTGEEE